MREREGEGENKRDRAIKRGEEREMQRRSVMLYSMKIKRWLLAAILIGREGC